MRRLVVASVVALLLPSVAANAISESALSGLASGLATTVGKSLLQPVDTIKTVQQTNSSATFGETARALVREGGPLAQARAPRSLAARPANASSREPTRTSAAKSSPRSARPLSLASATSGVILSLA